MVNLATVMFFKILLKKNKTQNFEFFKESRILTDSVVISLYQKTFFLSLLGQRMIRNGISCKKLLEKFILRKMASGMLYEYFNHVNFRISLRFH